MNTGLASLCTLAVLATCQLAIAGDTQSPRVASYELDVSFDPARGSMLASASIRFDDPSFSGDSVTCYLHGELDVDSIIVDGMPARFVQAKVLYDYDYSLIANAVTIAVNDGLPRNLCVAYSGFFNPSKSRSPSDYMRIDRDGVFLRAYGYSLWFPVFLPARVDDYAVDFARVTARLPRDFTGVFGGTRIYNRIVADTSVCEWRATQMQLFEAQFTARRYNALESDAGFTVYHLSDSASTAAAQKILTFSESICALYGSRYHNTGDSDRYFILEMPPYGDISSGSVTGLMESTWKIFTDDENAQRALAHELVHPYVHLPIPRSDSAFSLIVEGFPSYFHLPCVAKLRDTEFYNRFIGWMEELYLDKRATGTDRRGNSLPPEKPLLAISADELSTYKDEFVLSDRALLFLNYLRSRMGAGFDTFTSELFNPGVTSMAEFRTLIETHLPGSGAEIRIWLETTDYPERLHFSNFRMGG